MELLKLAFETRRFRTQRKYTRKREENLSQVVLNKIRLYYGTFATEVLVYVRVVYKQACQSAGEQNSLYK